MDDGARFEAFLLELLERVSGMPARDTDSAVRLALRQIAEAMVTDRVVLMEFEPVGSHVRIAHAWTRPGTERLAADAAVERVFAAHVARVARGETVAVEHAPVDLAAGSGMKSILIVPASVGGRFVCALSTVTFRVYHAWPAPLVARFRLTAQVLAGALAARRVEEEIPQGRTAGMRTLDEVEREHIRGVLERCGWKINGPGHAAEVLALHPNTLRFRMKKLGVTRPAR